MTNDDHPLENRGFFIGLVLGGAIGAVLGGILLRGEPGWGAFVGGWDGAIGGAFIGSALGLILGWRKAISPGHQRRDHAES